MTINVNSLQKSGLSWLEEKLTDGVIPFFDTFILILNTT
jgi:hypothetical protein